jgi:hypothetical protein
MVVLTNHSSSIWTGEGTGDYVTVHFGTFHWRGRRHCLRGHASHASHASHSRVRRRGRREHHVDTGRRGRGRKSYRVKIGKYGASTHGCGRWRRRRIHIHRIHRIHNLLIYTLLQDKKINVL